MAKRLDLAMRRDPFTLDESACLQAAQELQRYKSEPYLSQGEDSREAAALFKLFFVAICHQVNWDFLLGRMKERFYSPDPKEMILRALNCTASDIEMLLDGYARPERIRANERAKILKETASIIKDFSLNDLTALLFPSSVEGAGGLIEQINIFPAFSQDPVKKKSNVFAQELMRESIATFNDESRVQPAVDYHLIRLYLRTGRVVAKDAIVAEVFTSALPTRMRLITLLRKKVGEALALTAFYAKKTIFEVNYIEWQIARQRCHSDQPNCTGPWDDLSFDSAVVAISATRCPYSHWCLANNDPDWKALKEPEVRKAFY
jgi:hypothetical protein